MYEVMTRRLPFYHLPNQQPQQVTNAIMSGERPDLAILDDAVQALRLESDENLNFVEATRQCMERCWHRDHDQRPTAERGGWRTVRLLLCMYMLFPLCIHKQKVSCFPFCVMWIRWKILIYFTCGLKPSEECVQKLIIWFTGFMGKTRFSSYFSQWLLIFLQIQYLFYVTPFSQTK